MELYVGLDVSSSNTWICVVDGQGDKLWHGKCRTEPEVIVAILAEHASQAVKVGLETGPLSTWLTHALRALGLPAICIDARHAKAALSMQVNKTDANDAEGIAQIMRTGWYREVVVKSFETHHLRSLIGAREQLVNMRRDLGSQIRGIMKIFGLVVGHAKGRNLERRVSELIKGDAEVQAVVMPLLKARQAISTQLDHLNALLIQQVRTRSVSRLLMTVPGVGPVTALSYETTIENAERFTKSRSVGAHLGLTPRRYQSGELDRSGRISKCGDRLTRHYLFEAAGVLLTRVSKWSALKAWATRLAKRIGMKKAKVALARKLAVILHAMWRSGESFRWSDPKKENSQTA
jgi:transposase